MEKLDSYQSFKEIVKVFISDNKGGMNNLPFDKRVFSDYIEDGRLYHEINSSGEYFFIDEGEYYNLYYMLRENCNLISINQCDKEVVINKIYIANGVTEDITKDKNIIENSGFVLESINHQLVIDLEEKKEEIQFEYRKALDIVDELNLRIVDKESKPDRDVEYLWKTYLKPADVPYDHYNDGRLICLYDSDNRIAGVGWYKNSNIRSEWRHVVVDKIYRGKKLGKVLNYHWMNEAIKSGIKKGVSWIEEKNIVSFSLHEKLSVK